MKLARHPDRQRGLQEQKMDFALYLNRATDEAIMAATADMLAWRYPLLGRDRIKRELDDKQADIRRRREREALGRPI